VLVSGQRRGPFGGPERQGSGPTASREAILLARGLSIAIVIAAALCLLVGCGAPKASQPIASAGVSSTSLPEIRTVALPYRGYGMARVVGSALYVSVDSGSGLIDTLVRYDLDTGQSRPLFTVPADIAWITVNERWLLWESEKTLYAEPVGGGDQQVLATSREAYGPALEGDLAAWVDHEEGSEPRIVAFNLGTGQKREIARTHIAEFYNNFMQIRDGKLLWTDIYDGTGHYLVHDLKTGKTGDYPLPAVRFRYPGYAVRSGDAVYSINFDRYDHWDWSAQQVGRYSIANRGFTPVTKKGEYVNALVIGRDAVAIIDSDQRLLVGSADGSYPRRDLSDAVGGQVDAVQVSSDGVTAVAGRSSPESAKTTLFIFQLR
jgi:hypothetical protein